MKNQFFYTRKVTVASPVVEGEEPKEPTIKIYTDSFNVDMVIRTVQLEDNKMVVILNDFHEETRQVPIFNKKREMTGTKNEKNTYQSEIYLEQEDALRFKAFAGVEV